jgi:hypothetical protein
MAKAKKIKEVEAVKVETTQPTKETHVFITGTGKGGLVEGQEYKYPIAAAKHLINIGHAKNK